MNLGSKVMTKRFLAAALVVMSLCGAPTMVGWVATASAFPQNSDTAHGVEGDHNADHGATDHGDSHGDQIESNHAPDDGDHHADHGGDHGSHGNTNPLSVDPDLAIFTAVIFALLAIILRKFAWGPIRDAVEQREKRIADQLSEAQRSNDEARRLLEEHEAKLASSSEEVKTLLDEARRDAEQQKGRIIAEAEEAAAAQKDRVVREIEAAKHSALESLAASSVDQAVSLAGRIVGQSLNKDDHSKLIQDALKQFPSDN